MFNHQIPNWLESEQAGSTNHNPFSLPDPYLSSQQKNVCPSNSFSLSHYGVGHCLLKKYINDSLILLFFNPQHKSLEEVKRILREAQLEESRKRELSNALHACFKDWLYGMPTDFMNKLFLVPFKVFFSHDTISLCI